MERNTANSQTGEEQNFWERVCAINFGLLLIVKTKSNQAKKKSFQIKIL